MTRLPWLLALVLGTSLSACGFGDDHAAAILVTCGDRHVDVGESCDDGNTTDGDGCSATCAIETAAAVCGNHVREAGEGCDDGNTTDGDGCSATCAIETASAVCGNHVRESGEDCDDGNTADGDGCSAACATEVPTTACTLVPQSGCAAGDACDVISDAGDTACRDADATGTTTRACATGADCAPGYTCIGGADGHACMKLCTGDGDCSGNGARCVLDPTGSTGQPVPGMHVCTQACSPVSAAGCPSGWGCVTTEVASDYVTRCYPAGDGQTGATCASTSDCDVAHACVTIGSDSTCQETCRVGHDTDCSVSGTTCQGYSTAVVVGTTEYGVCL